MTLVEAVDLIKNVQLDLNHPQVWADLGSGTGLFSKALATLLPKQSTIHCCDREHHGEITGTVSGVHLQFIQLDFEKEFLNVDGLDGILMANSLHYAKEQQAVLLKWKKLLNPGGIFLVIEYDTELSNPWVPFPVCFTELTTMFNNLDVESVKLIGKRKSIYADRQMYACEAKV